MCHNNIKRDHKFFDSMLKAPDTLMYIFVHL